MTTTHATSTFASPRRRGHAAVRAALVAAAVASLLAACSASSSGSTAPQDQAAPAQGGGLSEGGGSAPQAGTAATPAAPDANRQVVKDGQLYLTVDDPVAAADQVARLAGRLGGRVDQREQAAASDGDAGSAALTIRVPADSLEDAVTQLGALGQVTRYTEKSQDVTGTVVDLDARITAAQTSVDRVQGFLEHAASTKDLLDTEQALSQRQSDLEQLRGQRASLADQVAMSTLYVSLTAPGHPAIEAPGPRSFTSGLGVGWHSLLAALRGASVAVGVLLPWLVLAALVVAAVLLPARWRRRRAPVVVPAPAVAAPAVPPLGTTPPRGGPGVPPQG